MKRKYQKNEKFYGSCSSVIGGKVKNLNIKKIPKNLPLFFVSGADDPVGDLGEGVKKVYGMYKDAGISDITYRLYEDDRHEILNETDRDQVMADIAAWLNVHVEL